MPEDAEVDTDRLHEAVHEELGREGGRFLKQIALSTAVLAALASVASLKAGGTVNEALALKTDATRLRTEASDQWAYYQAKGVKAAVQEAARTSWRAAGKEPPPQYETNIKKYEEEQKEIEARAREKEKEAEESQREAEGLLHRHHAFANAVALFQVSIALGAVAALTRNRMVWLASLLLGFLGGAALVWPLIR